MYPVEIKLDVRSTSRGRASSEDGRVDPFGRSEDRTGCGPLMDGLAGPVVGRRRMPLDSSRHGNLEIEEKDVTDVDSQRPRLRGVLGRRGRCGSTSVTSISSISRFPLHDESSGLLRRPTTGFARPFIKAPQTVRSSLRPNGSTRPTSDEARPRDVLRTSNDRGSTARTRSRAGQLSTTAPAALSTASAC